MIISILKRFFVIPSFHPALLAMGALIFGITTAHIGLSLITVVNSCFFILILCAFLPEKYHSPIRIYILVIMTLFCAGFLTYVWQKYTYTQLYISCTKNPYAVIARITAYDLIDQPYFKHRLTVQLNKLKEKDSDTWQTCTHHSMYLYLNYKPTYEIDDEIKITNLNFKQSSNTEYAHYLIKEKISTSCYLAPENIITLMHHPSFSLWRIITNFKEMLYSLIQSNLNKDTFNLFSSLFLGKQIKNDKLNTYHNITAFRHWGLSHYLARSGLHVVIIVIMWYYLLNLLPLSFGIKQLLLIFLVAFYSLLSWPTISFYRAIVMFIWYKTSLSLRLSTDYLYIIAGVTCCTLLHNPFALFFVDFQLSFGLTLALAWFSYISRLKAIST